MQATHMDQWFDQMRNALGDRVLPVTEQVADTWARLSVPDPLPFVDGLLAATAKVHELTIVTRNIANFARTGVRTLNPFSTSQS